TAPATPAEPAKSAPAPATASAPPAAKPAPAAKKRSAVHQQTATAPAASPAPSAPTMPTAEQQSAIKFTCRRDFIVHCRGVAPGGAEALGCLQSNTAKLTPDCKTSIVAIGGDAPAAAQPTPAAEPRPLRPLGPVRRAIRERMMEQQ